MNYFPSVILFFIHCISIHAAETKQCSSTKDLIVSNSLSSILKLYPSKNVKLLNLIDATNKRKDDAILEEIRQSIKNSSVSQSFKPNKPRYEFSGHLGETLEKLDIHFGNNNFHSKTKCETHSLITAIANDAEIGKSYEYLFKVSSEHFWSLRITLVKYDGNRPSFKSEVYIHKNI